MRPAAPFARAGAFLCRIKSLSSVPSVPDNRTSIGVHGSPNLVKWDARSIVFGETAHAHHIRHAKSEASTRSTTVTFLRKVEGRRISNSSGCAGARRNPWQLQALTCGKIEGMKKSLRNPRSSHAGPQGQEVNRRQVNQGGAGLGVFARGG
jgi:hypothetical protein